MDGVDVNNNLFELRDICFTYGRDRAVLNGVSLDIAAGDRIALRGPNGAGKTTLLEIMIGLQKPSSGSIRAFGHERSREPDFGEVRRRAGLLFEDPDDQLFSSTVEEDVAFGPFNLGWSRDRVEQAVRDTLRDVGLTGFERRITYHLSRGEKRLVSIASVLAMRPEVLLLDEPTLGLDENRVANLVEILRDIDATLVVVSHDADFLAQVTSRAVELHEGRIRPVSGPSSPPPASNT